MKLYMIRHGETDWNRAKRFQGQVDVPLNECGRRLAEMTRDNMPVVQYDRVYCSPLVRAVETAEILLKGRFPLDRIRKDKRIIEMNFGEYEGSSIEQAGQDPNHPLYNMLWHPELYNPAGEAESFTQLVERSGAFLRDEILPLEKGIRKEKSSEWLVEPCRNVLIVAHGALIRSIVVAAGKKEIKDFWGKKYMNCCQTVLDITEGQVTLDKEAEIYYDPTDCEPGWVNSKKK